MNSCTKTNIVSDMRLNVGTIFGYSEDKNDASYPFVNGYRALIILNGEGNIFDSVAFYFRSSYEKFINTSVINSFPDFIDDRYKGTMDAIGLANNGAGFKNGISHQAFPLRCYSYRLQ